MLTLQQFGILNHGKLSVDIQSRIVLPQRKITDAHFKKIRCSQVLSQATSQQGQSDEAHNSINRKNQGINNDLNSKNLVDFICRSSVIMSLSLMSPMPSYALALPNGPGSNLLATILGIAYWGVTILFISRSWERRTRLAKSKVRSYGIIAPEDDVTEEELAELEQKRAANLSPIQFKKEYITPLNCVFVSVQSFALAYLLFQAAGAYSTSLLTLEQPDFYMARQGLHIFTQISIGLVYTCCFVCGLSGVGIAALAVQLKVDSDAVWEAPVKYLKRRSEAYKREKAKPYYWVKANDTQSVLKEYDRINRRQKRLENKIKNVKGRGVV